MHAGKFNVLRGIVSLFVFCTAVLAAFPALAEPLGFRRARSTFSLGIDGFDAMTGEFGDAAEAGMSAFMESTLQLGGYFGATVRFGTARAFTKKDFLPFDNGYQFIYFLVAPRFFWAPFRKFNLYFYLQPEISLNVLMSNTLVKLTGNDVTTGAAGGAFGFQMIFGIVSVSAQIYCDYNWNLKTVMLGGGIAVGITSTFQ